MNQFYVGKIYSAQWIKDSFVAEKLISKDHYQLIKNDAKTSIKLHIGKRKRYSIMEGITMYDIMGGQTARLHTSQFWTNLED